MKKTIKVLALALAVCLLSGALPISAEEAAAPEKIKITLDSTVMKVGDTQKIKVSVTPTNAEGYELEYSSGNPQAVTAAIGTLIAVAEGTAEITVTVKGTEISDTVTVTVESPQTNVLVSDISFSRSYIYLQKYEEEKIYYTVLPENAANKNLVFTSLNTSIATVDEDGWVYGRKIGSTRIKVQSEDGAVTKYVDIYVEAEDYDEEDGDDEISVRSVYIYDDGDEVSGTVTIMKTQSKQFAAQIYPDTATDKRIRWSSSDDDIAKVDENGVVTGVSEGTVTIYATARDNGRRDYITIKIIPYVRYPDSLSIAPQDGAVYETGQTISFVPAFSPSDTTERNLKWFAYGGATVDSAGKVTITDSGKVTVKAYTADWKLSVVYEFNAVYSGSHFTKVAESYNVRSNRAIVIDFDAEVSQASAQASIFSAADEYGNTGYTEIKVIAEGKRVTITPVSDWSAGANYIFIKDTFADIYDNKIGKNLKFKFTVRDESNAKI